MIIDISKFQRITDSEIAVIIDCLTGTRNRIREAGVDTPNIDSALAKLSGGMLPNTNGAIFALVGPDNLDVNWET